MIMNNPSSGNSELMQSFSSPDKTCSCACGESKPENFYVYTSRSRCKKCSNKLRKNYSSKKPTYEQRKSYELKYAYGITIDEFNEMLEEQNNMCAACGDDFFDIVPHVDHCHTSGKIRGLVCPACNKAMGLVGDNADILEKLALYLRSSNA